MALFLTGTLYEVFIKNKVLVLINISNVILYKIISQSKICATAMKQKFKHLLEITLLNATCQRLKISLITVKL